LDRRLAAPQSRSGCGGEERLPSLSLPEIEVVYETLFDHMVLKFVDTDH